MGKSMKPGGGGRFAKLKGELASKPGVTNPGALTASIGRKKYGEAKMEKWSEKGKEKSSHEDLKGSMAESLGMQRDMA